MDSDGKYSAVPATVTEAEATSIFEKWLAKGFWHPCDLKVQAKKGRPCMVHVPIYVMKANVCSEWSGEYGVERYRRVTKYRRVERNPGDADSGTYTQEYEVDEPYTEWHPTQGTTAPKTYVDTLIATNNKFKADIASKIKKCVIETTAKGKSVIEISQADLHAVYELLDQKNAEDTFRSWIHTREEGCQPLPLRFAQWTCRYCR